MHNVNVPAWGVWAVWYVLCLHGIPVKEVEDQFRESLRMDLMTVRGGCVLEHWRSDVKI